jgi:hypothetical protein
MTTTYHLTDDVAAFLERNGADFTGNLVIRSESLDDYDLHRLNENGEWGCFHDSLSNRVGDLTCLNETGFHDWLESVKTLVRHAA